MSSAVPKPEMGPFLASQLTPDSRYELSNGHPLYCQPCGPRGGTGTLRGGAVLDSDPDAISAGVDVGFSQGPGDLRAPDIAVAPMPDAPGWVPGVPPLAVEYADSGQNEDTLQQKIRDLLAAGTRHVWVVRLIGPRRVEVHEPGKAMRLATPGASLLAPGILRNPVPVEALWDRDAAHEQTLRNLLQRKGYDDLESVREESLEKGIEIGIERGIERGRALMLLEVLTARNVPVPDDARTRILACRSTDELARWLHRALKASSIDDVFA